MSERSFVHLHVHTQYSLLDGAIKIKNLMKRCKELEMPAVAMTDHGNMYGAVDFQKNAKKAGLKPIIGCELYVCEGKYDEDTSRKAFHLTLIAKNLTGYNNLMYIVSMGWLHGLHPQTRVPRVDIDLIAERAEGLICLTGDLAGQVNQRVLHDKMDEAREILERYRGIFEEGHLFVELMDAPLDEFKRSREGLVALARELDLPVVATNDCHYLTQDDALAHALLMCIQLGKSVDPEMVMKHGLNTLYLKSAEEMWEAFADIPEACENTLKIADMIDLEIPLGQVFLPRYKVPEEFKANLETTDPDEIIGAYFQHVAEEGLEMRFGQFREAGLEFDEAEYKERLDEEVGIIKHMEFPGYFLIVWDFINYARRTGVPVGPGRGSGAGSLVAYAMEITNLDPLPYGLLFERFLNPERVSMPDFDIDFCMNRRGEVIEYVTNKYGAHNVGQIITYGQLKPRACIKDVGRALGFNYGETDRIAKLIPDELGISLSEAFEKEPRLLQAADEDPRLNTLYDIARKLENLNRQAGMHAAGIVISEGPIWEYVPICRGANDELVTQFAKNEVEEAGLVKFDFLGLKTLTVIDIAVRLINQQRDQADHFDINTIPMDDSAVFEMISRGDTTGVFQLESSGFQALLQKLKPDVFEDIVAAVALYRPGPLGTGMVDDFIERKHGKQEISYPHPWLEDVLRETYGTIVYQEQVMKIAQVLAGYSLGGADLLRRAMGKKKKEVMDQQREVFVTGAKEKKIDPDKANEVFDLMAYFAGYGFNKSHSAAYALITYQTGYLKAHFPVEFMAALMTCDKENTDKVVRFIQEARGMGIEVLPPDVNDSDRDFVVTDAKILFGLGAIKGVGETAIDSILSARGDKEFSSFFDCCERVDLKKVNKRVLEAMVKSGAFDSVGPPCSEQPTIHELALSRAQMFEAIPKAIGRGQKAQKDRSAGQSTLFGMFTLATQTEDEPPPDETYPNVEAWTDKELLKNERDSLGFYITGHPLDRYQEEINRYATHNTHNITRCIARDQVTLAGVVSSLREKMSKSGKGRLAFVELEDTHGSIEVLCFTSVYPEYEEVLKSDQPILIKGNVSIDGAGDTTTHKVRLTEAITLTEMRRQRVHKIAFALDENATTERDLETLAKLIQDHQGHCTTELRLKIRTGEGSGVHRMILGDAFGVDPSDELFMAVERVFGPSAVVME